MMLIEFFQSARVAILRFHHLHEFFPSAAIREPRAKLGTRCDRNFLGQIENQIDQIFRSAAAKNFHAFHDFKGIADGATERFVHRTEQK